MNRSGPIVLFLAVLLAIGAWLLFGQGDPTLDPGTSPPQETVANATDDVATTEASAGPADPVGAGDAPARAKLHGAADPGIDPLYAKALAGFRGRLVLSSGKPAAGRAVRFYRVDPALVQTPYLFAEQPLAKPELEIYESRSGEDGTFTVSGVWPQVFYVMLADAGGDHQRSGLVDRTPGPGEVVDLGDIALPDLGIITGQVLDKDGEPAAGALVRGTDLPGTIFDLAPVHRLDPEGGLIAVVDGNRLAATMPPWVRTVFDALPIPSTRTDKNGGFELRAVVPGNSTVVVNYRGHVPLVRKGVRVKPGESRKLGKLALREGEIAEGVVTTAGAGEPVVGAQVLIANKAAQIPVNFASFARPTDGSGRFSMAGLLPGPIYVAVRRSADEAWTIEGPVSVGADLEIRLPAFVSVTVEVKSEAGAPVDGVELRLCNAPGVGGPGISFASLGMIPFLDVDRRLRPLGEGKYRIADLRPADYVLVTRAKGFAPTATAIALSADMEKEVVLRPASGVPVLAVDTAGEPIRNVRIYAEVRGDGRSQRVQQMPVMVGTTDRDGRLLVEDCNKGEVRLSASHPLYGVYHQTVKTPVAAPVVFTLLPAGVITGVLTDRGKAPEPGKWTLTIDREWRERRGAMPTVPRLATPDLEGRFRIHGVAPGKYTIHPIPGLGAVTSPGAFAAKAITDVTVVGQEETIDVPSGGEVFVRLDASGRREVTGPSAMVTGTVLIDGRAASGMTITGWCQGGRISVEVDASGRFDLGRLEVGHFDLQLRGNDATNLELLRGNLWQQGGEIKENVDRHYDVVINLGSLSGTVTAANGSPAAGVEVTADGELAASAGAKGTGRVHMRASTDGSGRFEFKKLPAGTYRLRVSSPGGFGLSEEVRVQAGLLTADVQVRLEPVYTVKGKVDLSVYPKGRKSEMIYLFFGSEKNHHANRGTRADNATGEFEITGLPAGEYRVQVMSWGGAQDTYQRGEMKKLTIAQDLSDVVVRPEFEPARK